MLNLLSLLLVLYTRRAIDFSVFPTLLLVSTVFGLGLNVSSTRLILTQGLDFDGKMVRAFSLSGLKANISVSVTCMEERDYQTLPI